MVWEKDRATRINAEAPADVIEKLNREENIISENEEFAENDTHVELSIVKSRDEGTLKVLGKKRRRSTDGLMLSLELSLPIWINLMIKWPNL